MNEQTNKQTILKPNHINRGKHQLLISRASSNIVGCPCVEPRRCTSGALGFNIISGHVKVYIPLVLRGGLSKGLLKVLNHVTRIPA